MRSDAHDQHARGRDDAARGAPANLAQLLAAARTPAHAGMGQASAGASGADDFLGMQHLLFTCADVPCALPIVALREVLPSLPQTVQLPASPDWMLGVFPLRTELLGLVDPAPLLLGRPTSNLPPPTGPLNWSDVSVPRRTAPPSPFGGGVPGELPTTALVVGTGEACLAWAISNVGALTPVHDDEIETDPRLLAALPIGERYVAGVYTPPGGQQHIIVRADHLLHDLLHALEEDEQRHG